VELILPGVVTPVSLYVVVRTAALLVANLDLSGKRTPPSLNHDP